MGGVAPARPPFPRSPRLAGAMHITNIGGSLTTAVCLSLIAWSIRVLRAQQLAEQKSRSDATRGEGREGALPNIKSTRRAFARLSPTAFWLLVDSTSIRPVLVDVRPEREEEAEPPDDDVTRRLGARLVKIPVASLARVLRRRDELWPDLANGAPAPSLRATIVFLSDHSQSASQAANIATSLGFQRCAVIDGGLAAAAPLAPPSAPSTPTGRADRIGPRSDDEHASDSDAAAADARAGNVSNASEQTFDGSSEAPRRSARGDAFASTASLSDGDFLSRDALVLLGEYGAAQGAPLVTVIDVRRHDERALYGSIRGSAHLPAEHVPRALLMPPEDFLRAFHFRKPDPDATVVLYSRKSERATYAKQLFADAGMRRCLVLSEGVMGWGKGWGEDARAYDAFAEGEPPPEPRETKTPAPVDRAAAEAELLHKNVLL